ncbi:hypothetical protein F652_4169 [Enterobacteriaceae bacterium bta3-1]|nr:hypothetical protein F652_4169 [Enterobacteriaceae bacterium bta3-1]
MKDNFQSMFVAEASMFKIAFVKYQKLTLGLEKYFTLSLDIKIKQSLSISSRYKAEISYYVKMW